MTEHVLNLENVPAVVTLRPRVLRIPQAAKYIGVGETKLRELLDAGRLTARRNDKLVLIDVESLDAYLDALPKIAPRGKE